jgi:hypothetical protein
LGQSTLVVLCAGSTLLTDVGSAPYHKSAGINLWKLFLSPTGLIKPWFLTEGNFLLCTSYLPLGVPNKWSTKHHQAFFGCYINHTSRPFSGAVAGEKEDFCKGSLSLPIFLLCYCFAYFLYFIFACIFLLKIQKKLVPL